MTVSYKTVRYQEIKKLRKMANTFSKKMTEARNAWKKMLSNPTLENLNNLKEKMSNAGASHRNFSEMETPMPKDFACDYIHKSPKNIEMSLKKDFGPDGKFHKSKLVRHIGGTTSRMSA